MHHYMCLQTGHSFKLLATFRTHWFISWLYMGGQMKFEVIGYIKRGGTVEAAEWFIVIMAGQMA